MLKLSLALFLLLGISSIGVGTHYFTSSEFMAYHSGAVQTDWSDLDGNFQGLFLGMLKAMGAGSITIGLAIVYMSLKGLRGVVSPYVILLPFSVIVYFSLTTYASYTVQLNTVGEPPLVPALATGGLALFASALLIAGFRQQGEHQ